MGIFLGVQHRLGGMFLPSTIRSGTTWSHQKPRVPTAFAVPGSPADLSIRWSPGTARVVPRGAPPGTTAELRGVPVWVKPAMPNAEASLESPTLERLEVMPIYWNLRISIICESGSQDLDNQIPFLPFTHTKNTFAIFRISLPSPTFPTWSPNHMRNHRLQNLRWPHTTG